MLIAADSNKDKQKWLGEKKGGENLTSACRLGTNGVHSASAYGFLTIVLRDARFENNASTRFTPVMLSATLGVFSGSVLPVFMGAGL